MSSSSSASSASALPALVEFARYYSNCAWQVLPLHTIRDGNICSCGDTGCRSVAKHPTTKRGLLDASDLLEDINAWWAERPNANIGIRTGEESGIWVLDVDKKSGGDETLAALEAIHGALIGPCVITGGGGRHFYFLWDKNAEVRSRQNVARGIDTRGLGGYVVAPNSLHESGHHYVWAEGRSPSDVGITLAPAWLLELVCGGNARNVAAPAAQGGSENRAAVFAPLVLKNVLDQRRVAEIKSALAAIPGVERQDWLEVGMALHSTGAAEQGYQIWAEWSRAASPEKFDAVDQRRVWRSFTGKQNEITILSVFKRANDLGWVSDIPPADYSEMLGGLLALCNKSEAEKNGASHDALVAAGGAAPAFASVAAVAAVFGAQIEINPAAAWKRPTKLLDEQLGHPFPLDLFIPESIGWFGEYVKAVAEQFQVPIDLPVLGALPVITVAMAKKFRVQPREKWRESSALWTLIAMDSGERKTPVYAELLQPLRLWERREAEASQRQKIVTRGSMQAVKSEIRSLTQRKRKGHEGLDDQIGEAHTRLENLKSSLSTEPQIYISESSPEALGRIMEMNHGRMLIAHTESDPLDNVLGRYSGRPNLGLWLSGYSGEYRAEARITREGSRITDPALSVSIATQPMSLREMYTTQLAIEKGFIQRFLVCFPRGLIGQRNSQSKPIPDELQAKWVSSILWLLDQPFGMEQDLTLSSDAHDLLIEFMDDIEAKIPKQAAHLQPWYAKLAGSVCRIAGALHGLFIPRNPAAHAIQADFLKAAIDLVPYLESHLRVMFAEINTDRKLRIAESLILWMAKLKPDEAGIRTFTRRAAYMRSRGLSCVSQVTDIDDPLVLLADDGWIRANVSPPHRVRGKIPGISFIVHPEIEDLAKEAKILT